MTTRKKPAEFSAGKNKSILKQDKVIISNDDYTVIVDNNDDGFILSRREEKGKSFSSVSGSGMGQLITFPIRQKPVANHSPRDGEWSRLRESINGVIVSLSDLSPKKRWLLFWAVVFLLTLSNL